jgi:xylan 1,4-beta-xylosidase
MQRSAGELHTLSPEEETVARQFPIARRRLLQASAGSLASAIALGSAGKAAEASSPSGANPTFGVDLRAAGKPLKHFWEPCIGGDHAKQALRRDFQDQLTRAHRELGVRSVRMHGVLAPQMSVYANPRGANQSPNPYSFFNVHQAYDHLVEQGMHPFVELSSMPRDMAAALPPAQGVQSVFYYEFLNSPPKNFADWGALVKAFVRDLVDRYGLAEVRKWPFEVWNEPNLSFWGGTAQQYYELYRAAAEAVKSVDASIPVGGPATDGDGLSYLQGFLEYVDKNRVPIDFVSSHGYENNSLSGSRGVADVFARTRAAIPSHLPYYVTETGATYLPNVSDQSDTSYAAAFWVKTVAECHGITDVLSLWCFSDIFEEEQQASRMFNGGYGALTMYGTPKPVYRAFELLHGLGDRRMPVTEANVPATLGMLAAGSARGGYDLILYNHSLPNGGAAAKQETVTVRIHGAAPTHTASLTRIDADHGNSRQEWFDMGSPLYPNKAQVERIEAASQVFPTPIAPVRSADKPGKDVTFEIVLPAEGVAALHLR